MNKLQIIDNAIVIKEVFGSFKILDEFEPWDIPEVIQFARIVYNYNKMLKLHDERSI
jgi:hypothetical protein